MHFAQPVERRPRFGKALIVGVRSRLAHRVSRFLETPRRLHHLGRVLLPRQPLEPSGRLFGLLGQSALGRAATGLRRLPAAGPATLPFRLLLLSTRQLLETLHQLVNLVVGGLLLSALHRLVLVLQLVELELEQVRQVLGGVLAATTTTTAAAALLHPHLVVSLFGPLQVLQGTLLGRQRRILVLPLQRVFRRFHLGGCTRENCENRPERRVGRHHPTVHPAQQCLDLFAQPALGQRQKHEILAILLLAEGVAVANHIEGCRDDLALRLGEGAGVAATAATTTAAAALRVGGSEIAAKRPNLDEVEVALDHPLGAVLVVPGAAVIGDEVARLELEFLEKEGVAARELLQPTLLRVEQAHGLLRPAVDRVGQTERPDAEVVVGPRLEKYLFNRARRRVATRLDEHDGWRLVGQHVDRVLGRRAHQLAARPLHLDLIEAILLNREAGCQDPVLAAGHRRRVRLVEHQPAGRRIHRRERAQPHLGATQHGDVAAVLNQPRLEPRIGGEVILELEVLDIGQVDDVEGERLRIDAVGLDKVAGLVTDIEQHRLEPTSEPRLPFLRDERNLLERCARTGAHEQVDVAGLETKQLGGDIQVGSARDGRVARQHCDAIWARGLDTPGRGHQRGRAETQIGRSQDEGEQRRRRHHGEVAGRAPDLLAFHRRSPVEHAAVLHGRLNESLDERRRVVRIPGLLPALGFLERAQHRRLKRWVVLFQIERHALVGNRVHQRTDQEPIHQPTQRQIGQGPKGDDRRGRKLEELESV